MMDLETINKLYLELSQVTTARTARERMFASCVESIRQLVRGIKETHGDMGTVSVLDIERLLPTPSDQEAGR